MIKEAKGFGSTIEEAKENAIANLGASDFDDVQFDVIAMPKKKVLGIFGGNKAEVRAFIELPDKESKPSKKSGKTHAKKEKPSQKAVATPVKVADKQEKKTEPVKKASNDTVVYSEPVNASEIPSDSPAAKAISYIKAVLESLDCKEVSITVASRENSSLISLDGDDLNIIIGRRGETLDSLQYLASLAANNGGGHHKISLNIGNYREKREQTLTTLADRIAAQVIKTGKSRTLEPMNPYERRIIHTAIQNIDGVHSASFGEGVGRRVVIAPEGVEIKPRYNNERRGNNRNRRPTQAKQSTAVSPTLQREPKKDSDIPLYGKIN